MNELTPLLPIDTLREEIGFHPWHFWQCANSTVPVTSACNTEIYEYSWRGADEAGRHEIRQAIVSAEQQLLKHLRYSVMPRYVTETVPFPRPYDTRLQYLGRSDRDGRWLSVQLSEGYIQAMGVESLTQIGTVTTGAGSLVYSAQSGSLQDTFTATIATTVTDPNEIAVYFAAADRLNGEGTIARWRIQPVSVSISGGVATIRGRKWLVVRPALYEDVTTRAIDPAIIGNFVTSLEIYRRTTNSSGTTTSDSHAVLIWETEPYPYWGCCGTVDSSGDPAAVAVAIARGGIRDAIHGIVSVGEAEYNSSSGTWSRVCWDQCRQPDRVLIRYLAGYPLENGQISRMWRAAVARLAAAELQPRIGACDVGSYWLWRWQFDLSRAAGANDEQYSLSAEDLNNPFGTKAGQVYAWKVVKSMRQTRGFLPG